MMRCTLRDVLLLSRHESLNRADICALGSDGLVWYYLEMKNAGAGFFAVVTALISLFPFQGYSQATNLFEPLRVYAIKPACFEYMFTSSMEKSEGRPGLSFNHVNGRTVFAGIGDSVGEYIVKSYEPGVELVFNPSVDSYVQKKTGTVILQSAGGKKITLEMGKILPQPGWIACMVWLDSGNWMYVNENDAVLVGDAEVPVSDITDQAVTLMAGDSKYTVSAISDNEKSGLLALWESRRKAREEETKLAEEKQEQEETVPKPVITQVIRHAPPLQVPEPPSRRFIAIKTPPQFFYGTEFRYPVSFETIPIIEKTSSGTRIRQAIVVPKLFQTGWAGYGITQSPHGTQITVPR